MMGSICQLLIGKESNKLKGEDIKGNVILYLMVPNIYQLGQLKVEDSKLNLNYH